MDVPEPDAFMEDVFVASPRESENGEQGEPNKVITLPDRIARELNMNRVSFHMEAEAKPAVSIAVICSHCKAPWHPVRLCPKMLAEHGDAQGIKAFYNGQNVVHKAEYNRVMSAKIRARTPPRQQT